MKFLLIYTILHQIIILSNIKYYFNIYIGLKQIKKNYSIEETKYSFFAVLSWICLFLNINYQIIILIIFNLIPFKEKFGWVGYLFSCIVNIIFLSLYLYFNL